MTVVTTPEQDVETELIADPSGLIRRRIRTPGSVGMWFSFIWMGLLVVVALIVQWLPLHNYGLAVGNVNQPPSWSREFLGLDVAGRSMLSRLLYGARTSLAISAVATLVSAAVGNVLGLFAAYFESWVETIGEVIANSILSVPGLLLLLLITFSLGSSIPVLMFGTAILFIPQFLRLSRANGKRELTREYLVAARGLGASWPRIIFRELVPNTWPSLISYAALVAPAVIVLEGSLGYLGFGVQPPTPSWGNMIAIGLPEFENAPWPVIEPCIMLGITVFALVTIGDYLRARFAARGTD